ncbi:helix-turn-helix domain-containing protein [Mariniflexile soesokkakense]|uniref:Helix-turn-helix domain-containing protein n=1 Tax=Mariniflexile soesokkakense TaxID=1343160 RepID=A0ABV0A9G9_9FLAO
MEKIEINNFKIADLEQAIKNVITETVIKEVRDKLTPSNEVNISLFTRETTAKMLCISLPTLNEWTKTGIIKAYRIGGRVLYKHEDISNALCLIATNTKRGGKSC